MSNDWAQIVCRCSAFLPSSKSGVSAMSGPNASFLALNLEVGPWREGVLPLRRPRPPQPRPQPFLCPRCDMWIHGMKQYAFHWKTKKHQRRNRAQTDRSAAAMRFLGVFLAEKWVTEERYRKNQVLIRKVLWWVNEYFRTRGVQMGACGGAPASLK